MENQKKKWRVEERIEESRVRIKAHTSGFNRSVGSPQVDNRSTTDGQSQSIIGNSIERMHSCYIISQIPSKPVFLLFSSLLFSLLFLFPVVPVYLAVKVPLQRALKELAGMFEMPGPAVHEKLIVESVRTPRAESKFVPK